MLKNRGFQIPFNDAMDEQIILYMFNQGYEEREIESAVQRLSEAPSNHRQTQYAKRKMTGMKKDPRHAAVLGANAQKIQNAENNYLQTKYREGKPLTEYLRRTREGYRYMDPRRSRDRLPDVVRD